MEQEQLNHDDFTFKEFLQVLNLVGVLEGGFGRSTYVLLNNVLIVAGSEGITVNQLANMVGTGCHPGLFWGFLSWLCETSVLMQSDITKEETFYPGPVGKDLLKGFAAYGVNPVRWAFIESPLTEE